MNQPVRVVIVDDQAAARKSLRALLDGEPDFAVMSEGKSGEEAVLLAEQMSPDLILMDIGMAGIGGLEATRRIKVRYPHIKIIMVTGSDNAAHLFDAIRNGAQGYLLKRMNPRLSIEYLHAVMREEVPISQEAASRMLQAFLPRQRPASKDPLTSREQEILQYVAAGMPNRHIAEALGISEHTVKHHMKNILFKLNLDNRVQLARYAFERGYRYAGGPAPVSLRDG